ncbi:MAG TPA: FAD-binding protein, partial [Rhodocyclaceae bacterium]|nr:FAD-binding protein [Rhodocyclaceae bacterium]
MTSRQHSADANQDFSNVDRAALLSQLAQIYPRDCLLVDSEDLKPYECDGLSAYRQLPLAVALPENEAQVIATLKICHALGVPTVARGAGTGLSAGALPHPFGIVLSLAKMKKILHIDPAARIAVVQPGVRNLAISEAAAAFG